MNVPILLLGLVMLAGASDLLRAQPDPGEPPYSALYVFGDSLSGTTGGWYWNGRWSNGPMWPEILSTNWGLTYNPARNYAKGNATTSDVVNSQVPRFTGSSNAPTALFVVWAGGNDVWYYVAPNNTVSQRALTNALGWSRLFQVMSQNLSNSVVQLHRKGARTVMVQELDDGRTPGSARDLSPTQQAQVEDQVRAFNRALADTLSALEASIPNLRVLRLGFHDRWNEFLDQAVILGFTRTDLGALGDPGLTDKSYAGPGRNYVFWDANHPTSRTHGIWAEWFDTVATQSRTESLWLVKRSDRFDLETTKLKPGRKYTIETSQNLTAWTAQESFTAVEGTNTLSIQPTSGSSTMRLFRLAW
ncbi:MAG: SGNH/GDSL hydrolase family protein [Verrucomicrobiia bacterium]